MTFPARQDSVNGERRSFALLQPNVDTTAQNGIRDLILEEYNEYEERTAVASQRLRPATEGRRGPSSSWSHTSSIASSRMTSRAFFSSRMPTNFG